MSLSRRYGIILVAYHGSFHDGKELYTMSNVKRKDSKNRNLWRDFLNFPYFTGFSAH